MKTTCHDPIRITPATPDDIPIILNFIRELAEYEKLTHQLKATVENLTESLFGSNNGVEALILSYGDEPAGYCIYFHNFSSFEGRPGIYVEDIYITPRYRRHKLGEAAFRYMGRLAKERHCARLEFAVLDWNEPAIRFYESLGAQRMDDWRIYRFNGETLDRLAVD